MSYPDSIGLHLLCDYYDCDLSQFCPDISAEKHEMVEILTLVSEKGLTALGNSSHFFGPGALSVCINLSESHLNFHTWPELGYVSLDIFCCSKRSDLKLFLEELASMLGQKFFKAGSLDIRVVSRGQRVPAVSGANSVPIAI